MNMSKIVVAAKNIIVMRSPTTATAAGTSFLIRFAIKQEITVVISPISSIMPEAKIARRIHRMRQLLVYSIMMKMSVSMMPAETYRIQQIVFPMIFEKICPSFADSMH